MVRRFDHVSGACTFSRDHGAQADAHGKSICSIIVFFCGNQAKKNLLIWDGRAVPAIETYPENLIRCTGSGRLRRSYSGLDFIRNRSARLPGSIVPNSSSLHSALANLFNHPLYDNCKIGIVT